MLTMALEAMSSIAIEFLNTIQILIPSFLDYMSKLLFLNLSAKVLDIIYCDIDKESNIVQDKVQVLQLVIHKCSFSELRSACRDITAILQ